MRLKKFSKIACKAQKRYEVPLLFHNKRSKTYFLWDGRSWIRKGLEAGMTPVVELIWSKKRILTVYLNIVEFGDGIFGVEQASQHYFRKPAKQLTAWRGGFY